MPDDIVIRLRQKYAGQLPICAEAADEIEMLRQLLDAYKLVCRLFTGIGETGMEEQ